MWIDSFGKGTPRTFSEAMSLNRSEEGRLFVPSEFPNLQDLPTNLSLKELAPLLLRPFFKGDVLEPFLREICEKAFSFPLPLRKLDERTDLLELFHGPTYAFKDIGARFLAECAVQLNDVLKVKKTKLILSATSGDTGAAVASAFHQRPYFKVLILFPKDQVSKRQKETLTCWGDNILSFEIEGSFDDCQGLIKKLLKDPDLENRVGVTSANSINVGRILPQTLYYAYASFLKKKETGRPTHFIIPTGNMGNSVACFWAREMGFPIGKIYLATNANKTVPHYYETLTYSPRPSVRTLANAMDVGAPNNMERLESLFQNRPSFLKESSKAFSVSDEDIKKTLLKRKDKGPKGAGWGTILCPHTATAAFVRELFPEEEFTLVGTAHPSKFNDVLSPLIGEQILLPSGLQALVEKPPKFETLPNEFEKVKEALLKEL